VTGIKPGHTLLQEQIKSSEFYQIEIWQAIHMLKNALRVLG
jgi:hypothetical protein